MKNIFLDELSKISSCEIYGNQEEDNIGIVSFNILNLDPYELCSKLSEQKGFQTRAGCSCAGPYGHYLLGIEDVDTDENPGWIRVSIHFSQTKEEILDLVNSIKKIVN